MNSQILKLKVIKGNLTGKEFIISNYGSFLIGRSAQCFLRIPRDMDPKVSRKHLVLTYSPDEILVQDLESHNGTLVNGSYIATGSLFPDEDTIKPFPRIIQDGDEISIGNTVIAVFIEKVSQEPVEAPEQIENFEETIPLANFVSPEDSEIYPESEPETVSSETSYPSKQNIEPAVKQVEQSVPANEEPITQPLKKQFDTPSIKKPVNVPGDENKVSEKEETMVIEGADINSPLISSTIKKEGKTPAAQTFAKQVPPIPAGSQTNEEANKKLKVKRTDDIKKNLEEITKAKIVPPLSPDALGKKKSSPLKLKKSGTILSEKDQDHESSDTEPDSEITKSETIEVERDDVINDIDVESMVQRAKYKESKRTTKFKIKGPS